VGASTGTAHDTNGSSSASTTSGASTATATAVKIASAATYDPNKRPGAEFGPAANAIDGSDASVWDVTTPADDKPLGVGLVLDLGAAYKLHSLTISTSTQGFRVELYGAKSKQIPPDILDARWEHLIDRSAYADGSTVSLAGTSQSKLRYINLWFTSPRDIKDPRIAIRDVTVSATK
jgi:hypothetical protein